GVSTSVTRFIGVSAQPKVLSAVTSMREFEQSAAADSSLYLSSAVRGFFDNGGQQCSIAWIAATDPIEAALEALSRESASILSCPDENLFQDAAAAMTAHCEKRKDRFCILQSPQPAIPNATHESPVHSSYAAYYHPWITVTGPDGVTTQTVPPGGHVAGIYARTDLERGVWKAPAGMAVNGA